MARLLQKRHCLTTLTSSTTVLRFSTAPTRPPGEYEEQYKVFSTNAFLKSRYTYVKNNPFRTYTLKPLYNLYKEAGLVNSNLKVLDVGSGPAIAHVISAAAYAEEIVLSDYVEGNCLAVQQWVKGDCNAFDWSLFLRHVVLDVEGGKESDVDARQEKLRSVIKVTQCDAGIDPMLPPEYMQSYDVIQSFFSLECVGSTKEDYVQAVSRVSRLLKSGGKIVLYHSETNPQLPGPARYPVGDGKWMQYFRFSKETVYETLLSLGYKDITREGFTVPPELQFQAHDPITPAFYTATYK